MRQVVQNRIVPGFWVHSHLDSQLSKTSSFGFCCVSFKS